MKFSDLENIFKNGTHKVVRDCEFERVHLIGKNKVQKNKMISYIGSPEFISSFLEEKLEGVICTEDILGKLRQQYTGGICVADDPRELFWSIHNYIVNKGAAYSTTRIAKTADISETATIFNENVVIEDDVIIMDNVVIKGNVRIGKGTIIHENVVIGTDGFYYYGKDNNRKLVHSAGGVEIGNNVEIHPGTVVQKGVLGGNTCIGNNVKIDMLCKIGHDANIGDNCTITAGATVSAGNQIGSNVFFGIGSITVPNIKIGDDVKISAGTVIGNNISDDVQIINMNNYNNKKIKLK